MPAKLCQHEQDKTILALGPGLFAQSIFGYLPRKKAMSFYIEFKQCGAIY
jgi:hypothetical protein